MEIEKSFSASQEQNRRTWDDMVRVKQGFTRPARDNDFAHPLQTVDGLKWLGDSLQGTQLLCLAAGGGRQGPLYAAAGANVVVVDISPAMLELDRQVAEERGLHLQTVQASMDDLSMFAAQRFDIVIQPVSTCYVADIRAVYREVARVTRGGGLYVSQHKQPTSLQSEIAPSSRGYELVEPYYRSGPLPPVIGSRHREPGTLEFLHRWEELIGGLCRTGFVIEDLIEPFHADSASEPGSFAHRSQFVAPYVRIKARRVTNSERRLFVVPNE